MFLGLFSQISLKRVFYGEQICQREYKCHVSFHNKSPVHQNFTNFQSSPVVKLPFRTKLIKSVILFNENSLVPGEEGDSFLTKLEIISLFVSNPNYFGL